MTMAIDWRRPVWCARVQWSDHKWPSSCDIGEHMYYIGACGRLGTAFLIALFLRRGRSVAAAQAASSQRRTKQPSAAPPAGQSTAKSGLCQPTDDWRWSAAAVCFLSRGAPPSRAARRCRLHTLLLLLLACGPALTFLGPARATEAAAAARLRTETHTSTHTPTSTGQQHGQLRRSHGGGVAAGVIITSRLFCFL
jgi:hypothetical protein